MGESKRRKETDPNYGKVKRKSPIEKKQKRFDLSKISRTEWIIWAVLLGTVLATVVRGYLV
jgi:hypothetical protein